SSRCKSEGHIDRDRTRYVGAFHNDGASGWKHSDSLYRFGRECPTPETRSRQDRCEIDLSDGRRLAFGFHLFTAVELRNHFSGCFDIEDLRGLDLFHCRFTPDSRWNPVRWLGDSPLADELDLLEKACAARPEFMDRAAHLLLIARSRRGAAPKAGSVALA
ncbi:MAG TPA: hypothetical protein VNN81_15740, partial [Bradyrhizobium sp.]|nr:hypothetical protein [Bradyrhizobium sp.]